jgi:hypothetical protein
MDSTVSTFLAGIITGLALALLLTWLGEAIGNAIWRRAK